VDREAAGIGKLLLAKGRGDMAASVELLAVAAEYLKARQPLPGALADYLADAFAFAVAASDNGEGRKVEHARADRLTTRLGLKRPANRPRAIMPVHDLMLTVAQYRTKSDGELVAAIVETYSVKESTARTWLKDTRAKLAEFDQLKAEADIQSAK
jgi:hypothetical protein